MESNQTQRSEEIVALDVRRFETTRSSRSQLVSNSNRKPSSGVMKIDPKRGDYIAKRCDILNNDQLNELAETTFTLMRVVLIKDQLPQKV